MKILCQRIQLKKAHFCRYLAKPSPVILDNYRPSNQRNGLLQQYGIHTSRVLRDSLDDVPRETILMPSLSPTMTEGSVSKWLKMEGDKVSAGDTLAEIETDKATVALDVQEDGYLAKILIDAGVPGISVSTPIALIVGKKDLVSKFKEYKVDSTKQEGPKEITETQSNPTTETTSPDSITSEDSTKQSTGRIFSSPYARHLAAEKSIDLSQIVGSGPNGRIIARDVHSYKATTKPPPTSSSTEAVPTPSVTLPPGDDYEKIAISNIRRVTAERLLLSKQTIPHYYLVMECNVDSLLNLRKQLNQISEGQYKITINDLIIKAAAKTLQLVPSANSQWNNDHICIYKSIHINVAVNTDHGLFTPIVRDANKKGLSEISQVINQAVQKARDNQLSIQDMETGTFTISNLGMFGVTQFSAVINPPQACILAVGCTQTKLVPNPNSSDEHNLFIPNQIMNVTLSCDHRLVDGATGAKWLQTFKDFIENPIKLML